MTPLSAKPLISGLQLRVVFVPNPSCPNRTHPPLGGGGGTGTKSKDIGTDLGRLGQSNSFGGLYVIGSLFIDLRFGEFSGFYQGIYGPVGG